MPDFSEFFPVQSVGALTLIIFVGLLFLYAARSPAHHALRGLGLFFHGACRLASKAVMRADCRLKERNREVTLSAARNAQERLLEREFQRVHDMVRRDLSGYPALNRTLSEQLTSIEEDYRASTEVPPQPPEWLAAVEAVAKIPRGNNNSAVADILDDIHETLTRAQKESMEEYRKSCRVRHGLLKRMLPYWRRLSSTMGAVERKMADLDAHIPAIDRQMQRFEAILANTDQADREWSSSFATQFVIAGIVLSIAIMGGFINFHLIALPMSEMVGGNSYLGPLKTADVAAMVIILVEIAMGIFLMESLRITRMFPAIHAMDDQMRRRMIVVTFVILTALASVEAALAYMRDLLAADKEALTRSLTGGQTLESGFRWIASVGQMVLGFILPFALACVAIPMESFIHSARVVFGMLFSAALRLVALIFRVIGHAAMQFSRFLTQLYDVIIFLPLWIESSIRQWRDSGSQREPIPPLLDDAIISNPASKNGFTRFNAQFDVSNRNGQRNTVDDVQDGEVIEPDAIERGAKPGRQPAGRGSTKPGFKPDLDLPDGSGSPVFP